MTTVTIDDALATRLLTVRGTEGDLNTLAAEAIAKTVRDWEREARGRAEATLATLPPENVAEARRLGLI